MTHIPDQPKSIGLSIGPEYIHVAMPISCKKDFEELVFRATNLWPDAPPYIKEFADKLIHGKILQDYRRQDTSKEARNAKASSNT